MTAGCPLCGGTSRRSFARLGYWIRDCDSCGHRFAEGDFQDGHVEQVYGDGYFERGGGGYAGYVDDERILRERGCWYAKLLGRYMPPGTVLDVGCAAGFWLKGLVDSGWRGRGIEPNAAMADYARAKLGLAVDTGTIEHWTAAERFDLVALIQIVAHFRDPVRALAAGVATMNPAGHLLIETWDRESWVARGLGRRWHEYSPPSVLHWFSADDVRRLGERFGLREIARGRPKKRISAGHAASLLRYRYRSPAGRLLARAVGAVPDRLALPYPGDDLFWMLLRKSSSG